MQKQRQQSVPRVGSVPRGLVPAMVAARPSLALRNLTRTERGERDARALTSEGVSATSGAGVRGRSSSQAMCSSSTWKQRSRLLSDEFGKRCLVTNIPYVSEKCPNPQATEDTKPREH